MDSFDENMEFNEVRNVHNDEEVGDNVEIYGQVENEVLNESQDLRAEEVLQNVTEEGLQQLLQIKSKAIVEFQIEKDTCTDFLRLTLENAYNKVANLEEKLNSLKERNSQIKNEETVEVTHFIQLETVIANTNLMLENFRKTSKHDKHQENMLNETTRKLKDVYNKQCSTYSGILEKEKHLKAADEQIYQLQHSSLQNKTQHEEYRVERENMLREKSDEYNRNTLSNEKMQSDYASLQNFCTNLKTKTEKDKLDYSERETQLDKIRLEVDDTQTFSINRQKDMNHTLMVLKEQCDTEFKRVNSLETTKSDLEQEMKRLKNKEAESKMKLDKFELDHTIYLKTLYDLNESVESEKKNQEQIIKKCDKNVQLKKEIEVAENKRKNLITLQESQLQQKTVLLASIENINGDITKINNKEEELMLEVNNIIENLKKCSEIETNLLSKQKEIQLAFNSSKHKLNLKNAEYEIHCKELEMNRKELEGFSSKLNNSHDLKKESLINKFNKLRFTELSNLNAVKSKYQKEKDDILEELELTSSHIKNDEIEIQRLEVNLNDKIFINEQLLNDHKKLELGFEKSQKLKHGILKPESKFIVPSTSKNVSFKPTISWDSYSDSFDSLREDLLKSSGSEENDLKQSPPTHQTGKKPRMSLSPPEKDN